MRRISWTVCIFIWISLATARAGLGVTLSFHDAQLGGVALGVAIGGPLRVDDVPLPGGASLELTRFRVFKPGAKIVLHTQSAQRNGAGPRVTTPAERAFFRGTVDGDPESFVFLAFSASGWRGLITARGQAFEVGPGKAGAPPGIRAVDRGQPSAGWQCGAGELPGLGHRSRPESAVDSRSETARLPGDPGYAVDLAIDTDWELFSRFGSAEAVTDYLTMLIGASSAVYQRDVSTVLRISHLILWNTPDDPWTVTGDLFEALYELGDHWHANHQDIERTTVHLMSGKTGLAGGVAYGGVLCSPDIFFNGHWAGGYGLTGSLTHFGTYRDTFVVSHELGHNFNSRHTHCYNGIPGPDDPPIDHCFSGDMTGGRPCYAGATSLPPDGGSIMSYCHLQPGGYGNINLWIGRAGSFGERSERVQREMYDHVQSVSCLPEVGGRIFADGFESGDTSAWDS